MSEYFESFYIYTIIPMLYLPVEYELILFCQHEYNERQHVKSKNIGDFLILVKVFFVAVIL